VTGPPAARPVPETDFRGSREKQPRAFEGARSVRVVGEDDVLVEVCSPESARRYLLATNAEVKRRADGSIRFVRLRSHGEDRGHLGECHGRSTVTTERVSNDWGGLVGSNFNLKHKENCDAWAGAASKVVTRPTGQRGRQ
jgi:hypothetical protein